MDVNTLVQIARDTFAANRVQLIVTLLLCTGFLVQVTGLMKARQKNRKGIVWYTLGATFISMCGLAIAIASKHHYL